MVTDHHLFFLQVLKVCCQRTIWPNRTCFSWQFWTSCVNVVLSSPSMVCFSNHRRCGRGCCICWSRWTSAKLSISAWWVSSVRRPSHCGQGAAVKHSTPYVCLLVSCPAEEASHWRLSGTRRIWRITSSSCVWRLFFPILLWLFPFHLNFRSNISCSVFTVTCVLTTIRIRTSVLLCCRVCYHPSGVLGNPITLPRKWDMCEGRCFK